MLSIGIVGLPNVGKSTLFKSLTKKGVDIANYPFCTISPNVGVVTVPDERLLKLTDLSKSKKTIPTVVEFVDIAGLVKGASKGEGLGNQFLSHIREVDAIVEVVRIFENKDITHVNTRIDPLSDIETINLELIFADLVTIENRTVKLEKEIKTGKTGAVFEKDFLNGLKNELENGVLAGQVSMSDKEKLILSSLHLLTKKPIIYVLNKQIGGQNLDEMNNDDRYQKLIEFLNDKNFSYVKIDTKLELEMGELTKEEADEYKETIGDEESDGADKLVEEGYETLNLITFFTTGEDETRAWTIKRGSTAPAAGSAIHSDFEDKFIKAEVIDWRDLLEVGSWAAARDRGLIRTEGKEYIVKDGDVIVFKI